MKIAIIIERADINLGGAERSVLEMAEAVSKLGPVVDILAANGYKNAENIRIVCPAKPGRRTRQSTYAAALKNYLSENHYDIIHSVLPLGFADIYQPRGGTYAESILRNAESYQNKFVVTYKKLTAFANFRRTVLLRAERRLCKQANTPIIVAISQYVAAQFKQYYAVNDERIRIIPNGIQIHTEISSEPAVKPQAKYLAPRFTRGSVELHMQILAQLGIKETDNPVFFLFAAHNFRLKGLAVLLKAIQLAAHRQTPRPCFLIVVGGSREKFDRLAKGIKPPMADKKIIFLGLVRHIQNVLSISDVAVLPTFYDPCSRFILEALAAGKPVITTKFNGATDLFVNNRHGKVIDMPGNIPALAEAISYFADTNNIKKASEAIADDNLKEKISINRVAKQLMELYEQILRQRGKG